MAATGVARTSPLIRLLVPVLGLVLLAGGAAVSLSPFEVADTYCGRVAWDATRSGICADEMATRTLVAVGSAAGGVVLLLAAFRWRVPALMIGAALLLAAFGMNRLLEPTDERWCGSVLNRHRYYEPESEADCDAVLAPRRTAGTVALAGAVTVAVAAWPVARRGRKDRPVRA